VLFCWYEILRGGSFLGESFFWGMLFESLIRTLGKFFIERGTDCFAFDTKFLSFVDCNKNSSNLLKFVLGDSSKILWDSSSKPWGNSIPDENCEGECGEKPRSGGGDATSLSLKFF
jgi:hypothetical protein